MNTIKYIYIYAYHIIYIYIYIYDNHTYITSDIQMTYFSYGFFFCEVHPSIKFDFSYSKTQIHLLDIAIKKKSTQKFLTTLYGKKNRPAILSPLKIRTS